MSFFFFLSTSITPAAPAIESPATVYHTYALLVSPVFTVLPAFVVLPDELPEPDSSEPASLLSEPVASPVLFPEVSPLFSVLPLLLLFSATASPLTASCNDVTALAISVVVLSSLSAIAFAAVIVSSSVFNESSV